MFYAQLVDERGLHCDVVKIMYWIIRKNRSFVRTVMLIAEPSGDAFKGLGLRLFACWACGFESLREHGFLSCECCVSSGRGLSDGLPVSVVCLSVIVKPRHFEYPGPLGAVAPWGKINLVLISMFRLAFFNSIIDKHQHMHFFTFKTVLV